MSRALGVELILFNLVTLDGFFAGPDGELDWHRTDDEFDRFGVEQVSGAAGLVFGRVTYELMAGYWPSDEAIRDEPAVAERMNSLPKYVFSRTLRQADWSNSTLMRGDAREEVGRLKERAGGPLFLFGSADLAATLTAAGLIDEYRLIVNAVVLGDGIPLFKGGQRFALRLVGTRVFGNGNVLLRYRRDE